MGVVFGRLYDIAAVLAGLGCGFCGLRARVVGLRLAAFHTVGALVSVTVRICNLRLRTPPMILRVAVGTTEHALVEMVHFPPGDPFGGVRYVILCCFDVRIAADDALAFFDASGRATLVVLLLQKFTAGGANLPRFTGKGDRRTPVEGEKSYPNNILMNFTNTEMEK